MLFRKDKYEKAGYQKVPKSDPDLKDCLAIAGIEKLLGTLYAGINPEYVNSAAIMNSEVAIMVSGEPVVLGNFSSHDFNDHKVRKWIFACGLGYLINGKRFNYDSVQYQRARFISDTVLAAYAKFSDDIAQDPRDYDVQTLEERHIRPVKILSELWGHTTDREDREGLIRKIWEMDFGIDDLEKALEFIRSQ